MNVYRFAEREHAELFRERFGGEFIDPKDRPKWPVAGDGMSPGNRYARETGIGRTLGQLINEKMALVAICRRCMHQRVFYPASFIGRFGEHCPAIELRQHLRCSNCRGHGMANLHESAR